MTESAEAQLEALLDLPRRLSTAEHAAQVLRTHITEGRLLPGTRLREEQLAAAFDISRNSVREVFRLLAHDGLVEHLPFRGVRVRTVTLDDIREVYAARRLIEPLGVTAAVADNRFTDELRAVVAHQQEVAGAGDWGAVGTDDIEFHRTLVRACGSTHVCTMFDILLAELRLAFLLLPDHRGLHEPYLARNQILTDLIAAGERAAAIAELDDYLMTSERHVIGALTVHGRSSL